MVAGLLRQAQDGILSRSFEDRCKMDTSWLFGIFIHLSPHQYRVQEPRIHYDIGSSRYLPCKCECLLFQPGKWREERRVVASLSGSLSGLYQGLNLLTSNCKKCCPL